MSPEFHCHPSQERADVMTKLIVALLFVGLNLYVYQYFAQTEVFPDRDAFAEFPLEVGEWHCPASLNNESAQNRGNRYQK